MSSAGIVLAAGRSERFGSPKMFAMAGGRPLVLNAVEAFLQGGVDETAVVVAPDSARLRALLSGLPIRVVENPDPSRGMLSSVKAGLAALGDLPDWVAVTPGDIPGISGGTVRRLMEAAGRAATAGVVVPSSGDRRGHPILLASSVARDVLGWAAHRPLSDILHEPGIRVFEVGGFGEEILRDVDRPGDLVERS